MVENNIERFGDSGEDVNLFYLVESPNNKQYVDSIVKAASILEENYIEDFFGDVWFGDELANDVDWRDFPDEEDPDDELLAETPKEVVGILGFDPLEFDERPMKGL